MVIWSPSAFPLRLGSLEAGAEEVGVAWLDGRADVDAGCVGVVVPELVGRPDVEQPTRTRAAPTEPANAAKRLLMTIPFSFFGSYYRS